APRGLSAEEKRVRLLEIFHETKDFFQLKELEKLGPKMKGIVQQSVKEVLQGLVDDSLVQSDKIGSSNFFWSFPSQRGALMNSRLNTAKETRANLQSQLQDLQDTIENEKIMRADNDERTSALTELASTKAQIVELEKELAQYGSCDPAKIEAKRRAAKLAHEATIRWTGKSIHHVIIHFAEKS
ncbi:meiotic nuclear division protein 1, partial [Fomitiporia mediterranea MF3/22]|uniref:meiotic nuclear division protein 1 n=1 Tax=Fomitiporia mediterranea (strain MF3/22) TaxID=694068 RepID=UPI00044075E4